MLYKQAKKLIALADKYAAKYDPFQGDLSANDFYLEFHHALQVIRIDMRNDLEFLQRLGFNQNKLFVFNSIRHMINNICDTYKGSYLETKAAMNILTDQYKVIDKLNQIIKKEYTNVPQYSLKSLNNLIDLYFKIRMLIDQYAPGAHSTKLSTETTL